MPAMQPGRAGAGPNAPGANAMGRANRFRGPSDTPWQPRRCPWLVPAAKGQNQTTPTRSLVGPRSHARTIARSSPNGRPLDTGAASFATATRARPARCDAASAVAQAPSSPIRGRSRGPPAPKLPRAPARRPTPWNPTRSAPAAQRPAPEPTPRAIETGASSAERKRRLFQKRLNTREPLVPPKPKLFLTARSIFISRAVLAQ